MRLIVTAILCLFITILSAATGNIAGKVVSDATGEGMSNITVILEGSGIGAMTNRNGGYIIKNVPQGDYSLVVQYIGYEEVRRAVTVRPGETTIENLRLEVKPLAIEGLKVSATRAVKRETPIAFSTLSEEDLTSRYTTQDIPQLMDDVPGLFASSLGLGESEITMRGFAADKIQILINGIPVNDPESQRVYWSNWTGLSSNVKSVQVQRGAGSSMYGSGAFGGSVNIETMGSSIQREIEVRSSFGTYATDSKVADGKGGFEEYNPVNYNVILRFRSGMLFNSKFNYTLMAERKGGDSYVDGTTYDGWSFGFEAATLLGRHSLNYSLIGAPQKHNQTRKVSDPMLFSHLGREYNRNNSPYQENYYFKPQFSVRDEWTISENSNMMTNVFFTVGNGGGKYLRNDTFDGDMRAGRTPTGEMGTQEVKYRTDNRYFARHALWAWETAGVILPGFDPDTGTYVGWDPDTGAYTDTSNVHTASNLVNDTYNHTWLNDSQNDHVQLGLNTYFQHEVSDQLTITVGGEMRRWMADHYAQSMDFRCWNTESTGTDTVRVFSEVQRRYDYSSIVHNMSGFIRAQIAPVPGVINVVLDGQWANYTSEIDENPIDIFDFRTGEFTGETFYATRNRKDDDGNLMFDDNDYSKTFKFFSPKMGLNINLTDHVNVLTNFSIAYKEPRTYEWYDRSDGPNQGQVYDDNGDEKTYELKPEKTQTLEWGLGYTGIILDANVNYYITNYTDKIESVSDEQLGNITMNAGRARHQGWEFTAKVDDGTCDLMLSLTLSQNRWMRMNVTQIFSTQAENIVGKVVPFSPEKMMTIAQGFTFRDNPSQSKFRIGWKLKWWAEYYGNYTNEYDVPVFHDDGTNTIETHKARLPWFIQIDVDMKYDFHIHGTEVSLKLDFNNFYDWRNISSASWASDYGTNNPIMNGRRYMYVSPAPRFNMFLTTEVKF
ncbi:MAG: TonB-dependent receptor [Candidatus Cloacimonetes bacterium]|nr:TonB-dependent receptor [Candidatus Cloacimonadota bacterium]